MKIPLTIKVSYLPSWGAYEGIRELVQNAKDAEVEHSAPMKVDWYNDTLRIENEGTTLPTKALLLGHTSKLGNSQMIGKFGEGLKLGVLALVRAGHEVKIRNGSEVWIPTIERSDVFGEDVLVFDITGGREVKNRIRVEIAGVTKEAWEKMRECFLFLSRPRETEQVVTSEGALLMGARFKGRIFVKGIFVQTVPNTEFGYDLPDVALDRDRKMVEAWNLQYHTRKVFMASLTQRQSLFSNFVQMLENPTLETEGLDSLAASYSITPDLAEKVVEVFQHTHGAHAVPVANLAESRDVEHLGKIGVVVSKPLGAVLARSLGDALTVRESLKREVVRSYGWGELTLEERRILTDAIDLVAKVEPVKLDDIDVVDFRSPLHGQFKDNRILLAKNLLTDFEETVCTLVHEVAHRMGNDGDMGHVQQIERIWMGILRNFRRN